MTAGRAERPERSGGLDSARAATRRPRYTRWRRVSQLAVAAFFVLLPFAGSTRIAGSLVALATGPVDLVEPASALSAALAAHALPRSLLVAVVPLLALALVLGPVYCSWACPFGLTSELVDRSLRRERRWVGRPSASARRTRIAALLALLGASLLLGVPLAALIAPPRLATVLPLELRAAGAVSLVTAALLMGVVALELAGPRRVICRALCPAGAVAALLRVRATLAPRLDQTRCRCPDVAPCFQACPWGIDPRSMRPRDGCTTCLVCVERCPSQALSVSFRRSQLNAHPEER